MRGLAIFLIAGTLGGPVLSTVAIADTKQFQETEKTVQTTPTAPTGPSSNMPAPVPVLTEPTSHPAAPVRPVSPQAYQLNWLSINGGGAVNASSSSYQLGFSVGQPVAGFANSSSYQMGVGFWYGTAGAPACVAAKGDLNGSGNLSGADVVSLVNCVFNGDGSGTVDGNCSLCYADLNCTGNLSGADVLALISATFNAVPFPC